MKKSIVLATLLAAASLSCKTHMVHSGEHAHVHGPGCGHVAVLHDGHTDYLDAGHLHHMHGSHVDDHVIAVSAANPNQCTPGFAVQEHVAHHVHGPDCGHPGVPHGDHEDYLVDGHLH